MTYHQIIDDIFDYCVQLLIFGARAIGITYEEINVWFFIVFEPLAFALVALYAWHLRSQNAELRKRLVSTNHSSHSPDSCDTCYLVNPKTSQRTTRGSELVDQT